MLKSINYLFTAAQAALTQTQKNKPKTEKEMKKYFFMTVSIILIASASFYMILEAGHFFSNLTPETPERGYWGAAIAEIFLVVFSAIQFKGRKKKTLNGLIKFMAGALFFAVVIGSSFNIVMPLLNEVHSINRQEDLADFLQREQDQAERTFRLLKNQPVNIALAVKRDAVVKAEYKELLRQETKNPLALIITMITTLLIRVIVQATNAIFCHCVGLYYRKNF